MESVRQSKVSRLIQKEISDIFQKECSHIAQGKMITVTIVRVSPDLASAKVYLSIFPSVHAGEILEAVKKDQKQIRLELGKRVRRQLRIVPELFYFIDDSLDYLEKIDKLLKS
jgi:ribosome-binding factor A